MIYETVVKILLFVDTFFFYYFSTIKGTTVCFEMEHKKQIEVYTKKKEVKKKIAFC